MILQFPGGPGGSAPPVNTCGILMASGLRLGHGERRGLVSLDPADHDDLSLGSFSRRKKHKTDIFGTDMNLIIQTIQIFPQQPSAWGSNLLAQRQEVEWWAQFSESVHFHIVPHRSTSFHIVCLNLYQSCLNFYQSCVTMIRTDTTLDHSQKAEKV